VPSDANLSTAVKTVKAPSRRNVALAAGIPAKIPIGHKKT